MLKHVKGLFLAMTLLLLTGYVNGQTTPPCQVVTDSFTEDQLSALSATEIQWLNFLASESFSVQFSPEKAIGLADIQEVDHQCTVESINPFRAGIEPKESHQYFRIGETGYVVIFYSESRCHKLFERKETNLKGQEK